MRCQEPYSASGTFCEFSVNLIKKSLTICLWLNRKEFCQKFGIPLRTMEEWETGRRIPPEYIPRMLAYYTRSIDTDNARNEIKKSL